MSAIIEILLLVVGALFLFKWIYRKWNDLDLEEKKHDIEKTEEKFAKVESLQKNHPDYEKKKQEVNKFEGK